MMSSVGLFIVALIVSSGGLFAVARLFEALDRRAQQWPALWATALGLSVLIPLAGVSLRALPTSLRQSYTETLSHYVPLEPLSLPLVEQAMFSTEASGPGLALFLPLLILIYGVCVAMGLIKLTRGRRRVRRIITLAKSMGHTTFPDQTDPVEILVSRRITSPFAWSRIGTPKRQFIVIPDHFLHAMSGPQIEDILRHESAHLERRDDEWGLVLRTLLCLGWISPFAHALFARWSQATEIRCDMAVTATQTDERRRAYAKTLMQALHLVADRGRPSPTPAFSTSRIRTEKMRLTHILTGSRPAFKRGRDRLALSVAALALSVTGTFGLAATASADTPAAKTVNMISSQIVTGRLTAKFGQSFDPFKSGETRNHHGVDIAADIGTPIFAPAHGVIQAATDLYQNKPGYGTVVVLQTDDGIQTLFSHLDGYTVQVGQRVAKGEQIATVGNSGRSTGPHVHIETYKDGTRIDPMSVWSLSGE